MGREGRTGRGCCWRWAGLGGSLVRWNSSKDGVSQAGCVYPPATAGQAESPKHPCEPGLIKAQPQSSPRSAPASRFSDHRPDVVEGPRGCRSGLPLLAVPVASLLYKWGMKACGFLMETPAPAWHSFKSWPLGWGVKCGGLGVGPSPVSLSLRRQ